MVKKARAAGSFLGGIANNPGIIIIAALLGGLFIFRDRISGAFAAIPGALGDINIQLPEIALPALPTINLPEITFPSLPGLPQIFGGGDTELDPANLPPDVQNTGLLADPTVCECGSTIIQDAQGDVTQFCKECSPTTDQALPGGFIGGLADPNFLNFLGLTPAPPATPSPPNNLDFGELPPGFEGGGVSFQGGSILPFGTGQNIGDLSLSEIIDRFNVTASQAASLRSEAQGFTPEEDVFLQGSQGFNPPAVSDPQFEGLTPQEIANRLTGGNISNF